MEDAGTARTSPLIWPRAAAAAQPATADPSSKPVGGFQPWGHESAAPGVGSAPDRAGTDPVVEMVAAVRQELHALEEAHAEVLTRVRAGAAAEERWLLAAARTEAAALQESARSVAAAAAKEGAVTGGTRVHAG